jgi:hypothetical protein
MEEDPGFAPRKPLRSDRERLTGKGMEGMRDGEDKVAIHAIGCR